MNYPINVLVKHLLRRATPPGSVWTGILEIVRVKCFLCPLVQHTLGVVDFVIRIHLPFDSLRRIFRTLDHFETRFFIS